MSEEDKMEVCQKDNDEVESRRTLEIEVSHKPLLNVTRQEQRSSFSESWSTLQGMNDITVSLKLSYKLPAIAYSWKIKCRSTLQTLEQNL